MRLRPSPRIILALALTCILSAGCGVATPGGQPAGSGATPLHTLVAVQGKLALKRQGWSEYAPAMFGMALQAGDLLRLDNGAQATLACADLTLAAVPAGVAGVPCKVAQPVLTYGGSLVNPTRADVPADIPQIVAPRKTKLLDGRPLLRWLPAAGATTYKVSVSGPNVSWSTEVQAATEIAYAADAPALAAGATYKLKVTAGERSSEQENAPGLGFSLLGADEAKVVREAKEKIRGLKLTEAATRLLIARLYITHGLEAEAGALLETLELETTGPAVPRDLGDLYMRVGVYRLAEGYYRTALTVSEQAGDIEGQGWAYRALGALAEARGNRGDAAAAAQKALELYQKLGDEKTVKELQEKLATLR